MFITRKCSKIAFEELGAHVPFLNKDSVAWININGIHDKEIIENIGKLFSLHPAYAEDIMNSDQRPKMDEQEDYLFITLKMLSVEGSPSLIKDDQLSLVLERVIFNLVPGGQRQMLSAQSGTR